MASVHRAAVNNATWCAAVVGSHGGTGSWTPDAWTSPSRTPPLYPDAVTLQPGADATDLLRRIDASSGCSVKDSFAALDLRSRGFRVLFEATWIARSLAAPGSPGGAWSRVVDPAGLARWVRGWRGDAADDGSEVPFRPALLEVPTVAVMGRAGGRGVAAGAVFNRTGNDVGVSNAFTVDGSTAETWEQVPAVAQTLFPAATDLVGYETGSDLREARAAGFAPLGPLRVWLRD